MSRVRTAKAGTVRWRIGPWYEPRIAHDRWPDPGAALSALVLTESMIRDLDVVFTGEDGYAGLTAIVVFAPFVNGSVQGLIFQGSPPPAASPAG